DSRPQGILRHAAGAAPRARSAAPHDSGGERPDHAGAVPVPSGRGCRSPEGCVGAGSPGSRERGAVPSQRAARSCSRLPAPCKRRESPPAPHARWRTRAEPRDRSPAPGTRSLRGGEVHPELEPLLALQEKDQAVTATDEALAALAPELATLDEAHAAAERALAVARAGIQAAMDRRDELEGKIANYRTMQDQRRQRLEWVRGAKEASTLMAELDLARSVLAKEEAEFMRSGDAVTEAER